MTIIYKDQVQSFLTKKASKPEEINTVDFSSQEIGDSMFINVEDKHVLAVVQGQKIKLLD
jgi:hypothetical protein